MSSLEELIRQRIEAGQVELQKAVRAPLTGVVVRNYLPQTWAVVTEEETLAVHADEAGNLTVRSADPVVRDGAIAGKHDVIVEAIRSGRKPPANALTVTYYTQKGEAAFTRLSALFGF